MKIKVLRRFRDTETGEIVNKGEAIERSKSRGTKIIEKGVGEEIKEKKAKKQTKSESKEDAKS